MGKIWLQELPFNYDEKDQAELLTNYAASLLKGKNNSQEHFEVGDALKFKNGFIAVVVARNKNYENLTTDLLIANKAVSDNELYQKIHNEMRL